MSIHCLFLPFTINWIITNIVYTTNVIVAKFKLKILDIENGIDMIGDTPSPDFVFNEMPLDTTTSPIEYIKMRYNQQLCLQFSILHHSF